MRNSLEKLETDVLIIGGGIAGLNAAMAARKQGATVTIADKGGIARSGNIGAGVDHFNAYLEEGEPWDTREAWLEAMKKRAYGAIDIKIHEAIFCNEIKAAIQRMARIGNRLDDPETGKVLRTQALGQPGPCSINFKGKEFKPNLAKEVHRLNCKVLEKVMMTRLFTSGEGIAGAAGFHVRTGEFYLIKASAIILATGIATRLYDNPTGLAFNTWQSPYNTGDAQAMAFTAGTQLANMEYMGTTVIPQGFSAPGLAALAGMGCYFKNAQGQRFMNQYHPEGERASRMKVVEAILKEMEAGRGPVYVDCCHLPKKELDHLKLTLGWDKDTFPDYFAQKGLDIAKDPLEVDISEGMVRGPSPVSSGIKIDERCGSSLAGLFAAGDCADQCQSLSLAVTSGYVAGREAAKWAKEVKDFSAPRQEEVKNEQERLYAPLSRKNGHAYQELEQTLGKIMKDHVGPTRSEPGLKRGLEKLSRLKEMTQQLLAHNYHELMRVAEACHLAAVSEITARAALYRKETRFGLAHNRIDYPKTDNDNWCGLVTVRKKGKQTELGFCPLQY